MLSGKEVFAPYEAWNRVEGIDECCVSLAGYCNVLNLSRPYMYSTVVGKLLIVKA